MIDTHCHLAGEEFVADLADVVSRAKSAGVTEAICILASDDDGELERADAVRRAWDGVRFAIGVHPHASGKYAGRVEASVSATTAALDRQPAACAIGEIGLDYHYDFAPKDAQTGVFAGQVALAVSRDLPVVIHSREAMADTVAVLKEAGQGRVRGVIHCFTGSADEARLALDLGFYISFAGILTFPRAQSLRDAAAIVPIDRVLVETDSPFLAPIPHRGKRNEPAWVMETLAALAGVKGLPVSRASEIVQANAARLFASSAG
ncbi:MAG: TatD family deoxyribonuclease [Acidobacteria bacterium]|nr:MAG: TatD family deoxyribonuclease [Acidobacteriota bacterium]